jgi:type 11 methyltransferase
MPVLAAGCFSHIRWQYRDDGLLSISETAGDPDKLDQQELIALLATHGFTPVRQYGNRRNYTVNFAVADTKR